jgi:hypothetical protein
MAEEPAPHLRETEPPPQPQPQPPQPPFISTSPPRTASGLPVDIFGAPAIDPTKNVESLVRAAEYLQTIVRAADQRFLDAQLHSTERFQNFAREAEANLQRFARQLDVRYTDSMRAADSALAAAETRRIDQLAQTRQEFQNTIRDMLAASATSTSTLVATQLVQIQTVFDTRVSKLEAYQFTQAGKSSVQDPQLEGAMTRMASSIASLTRETSESMAKNANATSEAIAKLTMTLSTMQVSEGSVGGRKMGQMDTNARLLAIVMAVAAVASPVIAILVTIMAIRGHP